MKNTKGANIAEQEENEKQEGAPKMKFDRLSNRVIGCALEVHRHLGPGLLESTYEQCLAHELKMEGIPFKLQYPTCAIQGDQA